MNRPDADPNQGEQLPEAALEGKPRILLRGGTVLTMDGGASDGTKADVLIEGGRIVAVEPDLSSSTADGQGTTLDVAGSIVMPGFVNAHLHAWQGQLRGALPDVDLDGYMAQVHGGLSPAYRPDDVYVGSLTSALSCLDAGITCTVDNSHIWRSPEHADAAIDGIEAAGLRSLYGCGRPPFSDVDRTEWLADLERLKTERLGSDDQLVTLGLWCMASWGLDAETCREAERLGIRIVAELGGGDADEAALEDLAGAGILGENCNFNHLTALTERTWSLISEHNVPVNVCPRSDSQFQILGGLPGTQAALDHGVRPGVSTDTEMSYGTDMFTELRVLLHFQRGLAAHRAVSDSGEGPAALSPRECVEFATVAGARNAGLAHRIGTLEAGKDADVIVLGREDVHMWGVEDPFATVVSFAQTSDVHGVFVAGNARKWDGHLVPRAPWGTLSQVKDRMLRSRTDLLDRAETNLRDLKS